MSFITPLLGILSIGGSLIGAGVQAAGAKREAEAAAQAQEYNAKALEQQATAERDAANAEASDYRRRQGRILAERRAAQGASGLSSAGSPLLVEDATIREIALGAARQSYQGMVNESRLQDEAGLARLNATNSRKAGDYAAGATLLTGVTNAFGSAYDMWG